MTKQTGFSSLLSTQWFPMSRPGNYPVIYTGIVICLQCSITHFYYGYRLVMREQACGEKCALEHRFHVGDVSSAGCWLKVNNINYNILRLWNNKNSARLKTDNPICFDLKWHGSHISTYNLHYHHWYHLAKLYLPKASKGSPYQPASWFKRFILREPLNCISFRQAPSTVSIWWWGAICISFLQ